jgi:hypothetical protein
MRSLTELVERKTFFLKFGFFFFSGFNFQRREENVKGEVHSLSLIMLFSALLLSGFLY